jgi:16S rRNA (adenine1518-N6/adenine1519-N6)-dimethyltransferase
MVYQKTRSLLKNQGLAPTKKLGQNFLVHRHTAERIVDLTGITSQDTIVEIGVGLGALTIPLAEAAGQVIGLEADSGIIRLHREQCILPENVRLLHLDVLKADFNDLADQCGGRLKIIANLPYSISSPFLFKLIQDHNLLDFAVVMLQKEVASRLLAKPGSKEYGGPTVLMASCAEVRMLMQIKAEEFHPRPKVDSAVIRLSFQPLPEDVRKIGPIDYQLLRKVVNGAFGQRRKTLLNALSATGLLTKPLLAECIAETGLPPMVRAERLSLENFVQLSKIIAGRSKEKNTVKNMKGTQS